MLHLVSLFDCYCSSRSWKVAADVPVLPCTQNNTQSRKRGHLPDASLERKLFSKASSKPPLPSQWYISILKPISVLSGSGGS